jgi:glutamine amidotransferase
VKTLGVLDYGVGNMQSVANALDKIGVPWDLVSEPGQVCRYGRLLLPGVGAFGAAVSRLEETGLKEEVCVSANAGTSLLGICLGMQLLGRSSEESTGYTGLGLLDAETVAITSANTTTNTGFRTVDIATSGGASGVEPLTRDYYFNHGYRLVPNDLSIVAGVLSWNGSEVVAAVSLDNIMGVQFHPEKSQGQGLSVLRGFALSGELRL